MSDERTPPKRIRLTGLQEAQIPALVALEQATVAMYHAIGFDAAEVPPRSAAEIVSLTREHDVKVAEADHVVAGYMAWRDEPPGVAYIEEISVHPDFQRFGVGTALLTRLFEVAREARIEFVTAKSWQKAAWAAQFYARLGFAAIVEAAPAKVIAWRDNRASSGRPFTRPGESALWLAIPPAPAVADEDADDPS